MDNYGIREIREAERRSFVWDESIAVVPFATRDAMGDGLATELRPQMTKVVAVHVIFADGSLLASTSIESFEAASFKFSVDERCLAYLIGLAVNRAGWRSSSGVASDAAGGEGTTSSEKVSQIRIF